MKLRKVRSVEIRGGWKFLSAEWTVQEIPGLYLYKAHSSEEKVGGSGWVFALHSGTEYYSDNTSKANHVYQLLQEQEFPTRHQALQAAEMALLTL